MGIRKTFPILGGGVWIRGYGEVVRVDMVASTHPHSSPLLLTGEGAAGQAADQSDCLPYPETADFRDVL